DHVDREGPFHDPLDGETRAVDGDALARLEAPVGSADRQHEAGFPFPLPPSPAFPPVARDVLDPPDGAHDSGKHSRLSNTNNVSGPIARRSTGVQRGASGSGAAPTPGKAGRSEERRVGEEWRCG